MMRVGRSRETPTWPMGINFEWDRDKSEQNLRNHGLGFFEAQTVFDDPLSRTVADLAHSVDEERYWTIGFSQRGRLLVVAHTDADDVIRIISARLATSHERRQYEESSG